MRVFHTSVTMIMLALFVQTVRADGLFYQLPKDGTWVEFECDVTMDEGSRHFSGKGKIWMASVGTTVIEGKRCRWIEIEFETPKPGHENDSDVETAKALIPETELVKGKSPLDHAIRAWRRQNHRAPEVLKNLRNIGEGPFPLVLAEPLENVKTLPPKEITCKLGVFRVPRASCPCCFSEIPWVMALAKRQMAPISKHVPTHNPGEVAMWVSKNQGHSGKRGKRLTQGSQINHTFLSLATEYPCKQDLLLCSGWRTQVRG
ncbi:MAG: hypothetical protein JW888_08530 [Pirellulales bacterium]|nr:hypothetical protein [Pirellulales bacterium]